MKLLNIILLVMFSHSLQAGHLGEDPSNVECTKSIQKTRSQVALVKVDVQDDESEEVEDDDRKTISK